MMEQIIISKLKRNIYIYIYIYIIIDFVNLETDPRLW
jgi:hypothetical protein